MAQITNTSMLTTFSMIRTVILTNSTISGKINASDFYEFEPNEKSTQFKGFPYMIVMVPQMENTEQYLGEVTKDKMFTVEIILRMEWEARDNFASYASNIISVLESSNSTYQASGYNLVGVDFEGPLKDVVHQRQIVEGSFMLALSGEVAI